MAVPARVRVRLLAASPRTRVATCHASALTFTPAPSTQPTIVSKRLYSSAVAP